MPDHDHLVTTDQLNAAVGEVRVEIANLDKQLTGELAELRTKVRTGFANVNTAIAKLAEQGRIPDFPVTRSHPPASWPSAANSSICRTYRKTAGEESRRRSPVANRWMRP